MAEELPHLAIHPLLVYSQHDILPGHVTPLMWDLHEMPDGVVHFVDSPDEPLALEQLTEDATEPSLTTLTITCGVFPINWPIIIKQKLEITVIDVLRAIYAAVHRRISHEEWGKLSSKEQTKLTAMFEERCNQSADPEATRENGVLRIDYLLQHTSFAGLSVSPDEEDTCILTLRRSR